LLDASPRSDDAFEVLVSKSDSEGPTLLGTLVVDARAGLIRAGGCPLDAHTWRRAIGDRIASRSSPEQLRDGVLTLRVANPVWAQELSLLSSKIIERLQPLGFVIQTVRCKVGPVEPIPRVSRTRALRPVAPVELPPDLTRQLSRIEDDDLRVTIEAAARSQLQLEAQRRATAQRRNQSGGASAATPDARGLQSAGRETVLQDRIESVPRAGQRRTRESQRGPPR
jgi:hypothetical protein